MDMYFKNRNDMKRVELEKAAAVFLFTDVFTRSPAAEDRETTLRALSIRSITRDVPMFVQILLPETLVRLCLFSLS